MLSTVTVLFTIVVAWVSANTYTSDCLTSGTACSATRWADDSTGEFDSVETYTDVLGVTEEYRMDWEMYEGSIAITQMALVWKEISTQANLQIQRNSGTDVTTEVVRFRRIWQLESKGNTLGVYDDENENGSQQVINDFANMEYTSSATVNGVVQDWFIGDVIPFERCAYILNMNYDATNSIKKYRVSRLLTAVKWDPILKVKKVVTQEGDIYDYTQAVDASAVSDIPDYVPEIGYWPQKGSFFYFSRGYLYLKQDPNADMIDYCADNQYLTNRCDTTTNHASNPAPIDPCARDTPLFSTTMNHHSQRIEYGDDSSTVLPIAFEIAFDSLFVVFSYNDKKIYRISGDAYNNLKRETFFRVNNVGTDTDNGASRTSAVPNAAIETICSMDFHGLFVQVSGATSVIRLEIDVANDGVLAEATITTDSSNKNQITFANINYFELDATNTFHLLQTKGYYGRHRPCYMVTSDSPTQLKRVTTVLTTFFPTTIQTGPTNKIDLFTTSWSETNRQQGPQILRFHLLSIMPGIVDDNVALANLDYDTIKAFVYDLRAQAEWGKFALTTSGDGTVDTASGEECDPAQLPPISADFTSFGYGPSYDMVASTTDYVVGRYPNADATQFDLTTYAAAGTSFAAHGNGGASVTPITNGKVGWIPANSVLDQSGDITRPAEYMTQGYYTCSSSSFLVPYVYCGDGVPSNGPPINNSTNIALTTTLSLANQRSGDLLIEHCDDGNTVAGDGCAADCASIEDGFECLRWGQLCSPMCGNGHVEGHIGPSVDVNGNCLLADGVTITADCSLAEQVFNYALDTTGAVREECDMGEYNSPRDAASTTYADVKMYPCTSDCKLTEGLFNDATGQHYNAQYDGMVKWSCAFDLTTAIDWHDSTVVDYRGYGQDAKNQTRVIYEHTCTYLCGDQVLQHTNTGSSTKDGETCDIGGWAFSTITSTAGWATLNAEIVNTSPSATFAADVLKWIDSDGYNGGDPQLTSSLSLGCDQDCRAITTTASVTASERSSAQNTNTHSFKFDDTNYSSKGTDRCGDGIMDGYIIWDDANKVFVDNTYAGATISLRSWVQPTAIQDGCNPPAGPYTCTTGTYEITGYNSYWPAYNYASRILDEQCDNGGDTEHGCDRLCNIMTGWECFHYYHHLLGVETPIYTSICQETAYRTLFETDGTTTVGVRRLSPADFDINGRRKLHDSPRKEYVYRLPYNTHDMRTGKYTLRFDPKDGLNGQVRILESKDCAACFGLTLAYERDASTDADYWYYGVSDSTGSITDARTLMTATTNSMAGKQRNTFGPYMVVNKDKDQLDIYGYSAGATPTFSLLKTTTAEASVEYMGNHEHYWFPFKSLLMSKLSDGSSFRMHRLASNFRTVAAAGDAAQATSDKFDPMNIRLFNLPGRTMVPPVFWERMAWFYLSGVDGTSTPKFKAYYWNELSLEFEEKCSWDLTAEGTNINNYHKYSLVTVGAEGVILSQGTGTFTLYTCTDSNSDTIWELSDNTVLFDVSSGALTGNEDDASTTAITQASLTLVQARDDPDNYVSGTVQPIYGLHNSGFIQIMTWSSPLTLTTTSPNIQVPVDKQITISPEHFDAGKLYLVVLSPSDCAATHDTTYVLNASAQFYDVTAGTWACRDLTSISGSTNDYMDKMSGTTDNTDYWNHSLYM